MSIDKLLLQEIQKEAEIAKIALKKEVELCVKESNNISLSDYSLTCPMHPIEVPIKKCCSELGSRFGRTLSERVETACSKLKFSQYDAVRKACEDIMYREIGMLPIIVYAPTFFETVLDTSEQMAKIMILATPWKLLIPFAAEQHIKKSCEFVFQAEINSQSDAIVSYCMSIVNRRIDRILEYIENNSRETF